tara:strand:- start:173 stop:709 length:537 start_codon:yes stop_codon:yes gene_type:complete
VLAANLYRILGKKTDSSDLMTKDENARFFNDEESIKPEITSDSSQERLLKLDKNFNYEVFLEGAKKAFNLIVASYKQNSLEKAKDLISTNVYKAFKKSMEENKDSNSKKSNIKITSLDASILKVEVVKKLARIKVQFLSTQDIENSKESSTKIKDVWTFEKEINNQNPNWLLTEVSVE